MTKKYKIWDKAFLRTQRSAIKHQRKKLKMGQRKNQSSKRLTLRTYTKGRKREDKQHEGARMEANHR